MEPKIDFGDLTPYVTDGFFLQDGELPPPTTPLRPPIPFPSFGSNKTYTKRDMSLALEALRFLPFKIINIYCW
jgi:hypothetical protein